MFKKYKSISIVVRSSGESTLKILTEQLKRQKKTTDNLIILKEEVSFEIKLKQGFLKAIELNNDFTIFIDADILLRKNALRKTREIAEKLDESAFGFGFLLWDKFYDQPKFRGFHVYRTCLLKEAIQFIPTEGTQMRPETYVKEKMAENGFFWQNSVSHYVAGVHDFYQKPTDIYYKFLIRSKRSKKDILKLKEILKNNNCDDSHIALKGLKDGAKMTTIKNNKYLYSDVAGLPNYKQKESKDKPVDFTVIKKLYKRYGLNNFFWKSL